MQTRDAPSHSAYSDFICEEAEVVNVNPDTFTVTVETRHSSKHVEDITWISPYHHYRNGEGVHFVPEVGSLCYVGWPSDNTPPVVLGFVSAARPVDGESLRFGSDGSSDQDVSFRSNRMPLNPGDIALTTRDENFVVLRRGGVLQIGATPTAQRVYIPIQNYVKDFCENYNLATFGGEMAWTVDRPEKDPSGKAPTEYVFHLREYAEDQKATVRVRHLSLSGSGKAAWEVSVSPQGINQETGEVAESVYNLLVTTSGEKTEFIGGSRDVEVEQDDTLRVGGSRKVEVGGSENHDVSQDLILRAGPTAVLDAKGVYIGGRTGSQPMVRGQDLLSWAQSLTYKVQVNTSTGTGSTLPMEPVYTTQLQKALSLKSFVK